MRKKDTLSGSWTLDPFRWPPSDFGRDKRTFAPGIEQVFDPFDSGFVSSVQVGRAARRLFDEEVPTEVVPVVGDLVLASQVL